MGKNSAGVPDPYQTSQAQLDAGVKAVQESAKINAVNQYGPSGSTTYQKDAQGIPISQTVTLGGPEQQNYNTTGATKNALANQAGLFAGQLPSTPFQGPGPGAGDAVQKALYDRKMAMIQPQLDQADKQSEVTLANRGIPIGSEVYNDERNRLDRNRSDQLAAISQDATMAGGQEQTRQLQDMITARNQPYNEIGSLMAGAAGGQMPQFQGNPAYNITPPNVAQNVYNSANLQNQQNSSMLGGLFGLGSSALASPWLMSDERTKKDIKRVGTTDGGLPVYTFRYISGGPVQMGVMAQEVEKVIPDAVHVIGGIRHVDYSMVV